jgi:hypothetical protein
MNITEELKQLLSNHDFGERIIEEFKTQQKELVKKIHILNIVSIANKLEDKVATDFFKKVELESFEPELHGEKMHKGYGVMAILFHKNKQRNFRGFKRPGYIAIDITEQEQFIDELFRDARDLKPEFLGSLLGKPAHLYLKPGVKQDFLDFFLSKELHSLKNNMNFANENIDILIEQEEELSKKIYLLTAQSVANYLSIKLSQYFFDSNVKFIGINYNHILFTGYKINLEILDENKVRIAETKVQHDFLSKLCEKMKDIPISYVSNNLKEHILITNVSGEDHKIYSYLKLDSKIGDELLELLFSNDLKKIYNYNKMQLDLAVHNNGRKKELKI